MIARFLAILMAMRVSERSKDVASFKAMDVLQRANMLESEGKNVIHCEVGQPETGASATTSQKAVEALTKDPKPEVMGYCDAFGIMTLRQKIVEHYHNTYPMSDEQKAALTTRNIAVTTGSSGAIILAYTACFDVGDVVAVGSTGYPPYSNILSATGCEIAPIMLNEDFKLTANELKVEIDRRKSEGESALKGLIFSSPSNPTGAMLTPDELKEVIQVCEENDIQFISDEIYHGISYGKEEATAWQFTRNAVIINSFSKYYSMAGWRLGWMVVPDYLVDAVNRLQQNFFVCSPVISQTACLNAFDSQSMNEFKQHVEKYRISRGLILDGLAKIKDLDPKNIAPADGAFYVYVDLGAENIAPGFGSISMCSQLLEEEYVAFTPGNDFEDPSNGFADRRFRISYAGGIETCREAINRFHRFWPTWIARVRQQAEKKSD